MKSKLLGESQVNELLSVKSIEEVTELLEESPYREDLVELSTKYGGVELVNKAVDQNFIRTMQKIARFLPHSNGSHLFNLILEEWTMQNLKAIIASKATGIPLNESSLVILNEEQRHICTAAKDETMDLKKMVKKLAVMNYSFSPVFRKIDTAYFKGKDIGDFRAIYKELDDYYYSKLTVAAENETNYAVKMLLGAKVDSINTMAVVRLKLAEISDAEISENIVKASTRQKREAMKLIQAGSVEQVVEEIVKRYKLDATIVEQFNSTNSLVKLEVELQKKLVQRALRTSKVSVLSFAVILAFIYLKQQELSFIKAIAYSTQAVIREEVKALVFAVK